MIEKQAKSLSWSEFFEGKCQVSELAAKLYVTKDNDALKNQLMSEIKEARISDEIKMISMAATLFHNVFDQYKAFDDFT